MDFNGRPSAGSGTGGDVSFESVCATNVQAYRISQAASCGASPNFTLPLTGPPTQTPSQLSVMTAASTLTNNIRITVPSSLQYVVHRGVGQLAYIALQPGDYPLETALFPQIELALRNALYAIGGVGTFTLTLVGGKIEITTSPGNNATQVDIWSQTQDPTVVNYLLGAPSGVQVNVAIPGDIPYLFPNFPTYVVVTSPELNWSPYFSAPIEATDTIISGDGASSVTALNAPANPSIVSSGNWGYGGGELSNMTKITADPSASPFEIIRGTTSLQMLASSFAMKVGGNARLESVGTATQLADDTGDSIVYVDGTTAYLTGSVVTPEYAAVGGGYFDVNLGGATRFLADPSATQQYSPNSLTYTYLDDAAHTVVVNTVPRLVLGAAGSNLFAEDGLTRLTLASNSIQLRTGTQVTYLGDNTQSLLFHQSSATALGAQANTIVGSVAGTPALHCDSFSSYFTNTSNEVGVNTLGAYTVGPLNAGGIINATNGTVGAPSVIFGGGTASGIYRPAADSVGFSSSGLQVGRFAANGLSIRTPTTGGRLCVGDAGAPGTTAVFFENTAVADGASPYGYISMIGGAMMLGKATRGAGNPLVFTDAQIIATTGRVNIPVGLTLRGEPNNVNARLFTSYGTVQILGVIAETPLFSGGSSVGSAALPANSPFLAVGSTLRIEAGGTLSVAGANTVRFRIRGSTGGIAGTVLFDSGALATAAVAATAYRLTVEITAASATLSKASGRLTYGNNNLSRAFYFSTASFSSAIVNTFSLTAQYTLVGDTLSNEVATIVSAG